MNFRIGDKQIGDDFPVYFIADIAANHDGSLERAKKLIKLAKESGADAAKFQNFKAKKIVHKTAFDDMPKQAHQSKWEKSVFEVYKDASVPDDWTRILKTYCEEVGIEYFSTPYDYDSADHLDEYVEAYKIGSGDINWLEYLSYIAKKDKPLILSTGASSMIDVDNAVNAVMPFNNEIAILQCNTNYTADHDNFNYINLRVIETYKRLYPNCVVGLSDHTIGPATTLGAVALGAKIIEKHFTDDNDREGPDHKFAMNPASFKQMVDLTRELEASMGTAYKKVEDNELDSYVVQRRAIYFTSELKKGQVIERHHIDVLRPAKPDGIYPEDLSKLIGMTLTCNVKEGEMAKWSNF